MGNTAKLEALIQGALSQLPDQHDLVVGYSGGCDSTALLHALHKFRPELSIRAVHVNHGMQESSDHFERHCQRQCAALGIALEVLRVDRAAPTRNREAWAREHRYQLFAENLRAEEALVLAHHQRDQAETLLLNLLRGSGLEGLAAMPPQREWQGHQLYRPFLSLPADQLRDWAQAQQLQWIDDPTNATLTQDRNFIRLQVLPLLESRFAAATQNIARSAHLVAEALQSEWRAVDQILTIETLQAMPESDRRLVLRQWLRDQGLPAPRFRMWPQIWSQLLDAADDRQPCVRWPGVELRRYRGSLYAQAPQPERDIVNWTQLPSSGRKAWPHGGMLQWQWPEQAGYRISQLQGGERLLIGGMHRRVKSLLQQTGVPPWQRHLLPVLWLGEQCLAVGDQWRADPMLDQGILWQFTTA